MTNSNAYAYGRVTTSVSKTVKIPDPVYSKITAKADRQDVPRGVIVREWMDKAEKYEQMERHR